MLYVNKGLQSTVTWQRHEWTIHVGTNQDHVKMMHFGM